MNRLLRTLMLTAALGAVAAGSLVAQRGAPMTDAVKAERWKTENELAWG